MLSAYAPTPKSKARQVGVAKDGGRRRLGLGLGASIPHLASPEGRAMRITIEAHAESTDDRPRSAITLAVIKRAPDSAPWRYAVQVVE